MTRRSARRLQLRRQTLRALSDAELGPVAGGTLYYYGTINVTTGTYTGLPVGSLPTGGTITYSCP